MTYALRLALEFVTLTAVLLVGTAWLVVLAAMLPL